MQPRDLSEHVEYVAGDGIEEVARDLGMDPEELITLSSNENPLGPSQAAIDAIETAAQNAHLYPKAAHADLRSEIAELRDVSSEQVWLGNGGDGALDYLARATLEPGDAVLSPTPGFAYYGMSARFHHGDVREYQIEKADDFQLTADTVLSAYDGERVVYLTSPNNPTGGRFTLDAVEAIAANTAEETLLVVDEAYAEFSDAPSATTLLEGSPGGQARDDVAVLRTFSKAYGLAGLRLGYAVVPASWASAYARVNTPFAASELACRAGLAALEEMAHVERSVALVEESRERLRTELNTETWASHGNFVLADVGDASAVASAAREAGVIVRDCSSFGLPGCVRISCGTAEETTRAIDVLNDVLETIPAEVQP